MRITPCSTCHGQRLKKESLAVTIGDKNIIDMTEMSVRDLRKFLDEVQLTTTQMAIGKEILKEIKGRLQFLIDVGWII